MTNNPDEQARLPAARRSPSARQRAERTQGEIKRQMLVLGKVSPRFAQALKEVRLARHWKQSALAEMLGVPLRTLVSWETGMRLPSFGMVALLCHLLTDTIEVTSTLFLAAMEDDLQYQAERQSLAQQKNQQRIQTEQQKKQRRIQIEQYGARIMQTMELLHSLHRADERGELEMPPPSHLATPLLRAPAASEGDQLAQLFIVLERLQHAPELIPVVRDFLAELDRPLLPSSP